MIKNIKWLVLVSLTVVACTNNNDEAITEAPLTAGTADFSKYVGLGDSMCAGYSDGALFIAGQSNSYANILSQQFALVGGGAFTNPFMNDNIGGFTIGGTLIGVPRLAILGSNPDGTPKIGSLPGTPTTEIANHLSGYYNNMGVPGAKSYHLLAPGYGSLAGLGNGTANPYFVRFASSSSTSVMADALAQHPTFFSLWIGSNDVLGYATTGGDGTNPITPASGSPGVGFDGTYAALVNTITADGAKGVVANIPYVSTIPFFTTVPFNPLSAKVLGAGNEATGQATITNLNSLLYGPLKQALTAFGAGDRINLLSSTGGNPMLIKDESLANLSAQLTAAFTPSLGAPTAAFYGQVFGQARQTTSTDLVLLTTQSAIGSAPTGIPAPLNKYGITYPLEDKHILIPTEINELKIATDAYNVTIKATATAKGLAFVDANAVLSQMNVSGIVANSFTMTSAYVTGGAFSLDGVHPSPRGYALIANKFVEAINATYGSNLKGVSLGNYQILYPAALQ